MIYVSLSFHLLHIIADIMQPGNVTKEKVLFLLLFIESTPNKMQIKQILTLKKHGLDVKCSSKRHKPQMSLVMRESRYIFLLLYEYMADGRLMCHMYGVRHSGISFWFAALTLTRLINVKTVEWRTEELNVCFPFCCGWSCVFTGVQMTEGFTPHQWGTTDSNISSSKFSQQVYVCAKVNGEILLFSLNIKSLPIHTPSFSFLWLCCWLLWRLVYPSGSCHKCRAWIAYPCF